MIIWSINILSVSGVFYYIAWSLLLWKRKIAWKRFWWSAASLLFILGVQSIKIYLNYKIYKYIQFVWGFLLRLLITFIVKKGMAFETFWSSAAIVEISYYCFEKFYALLLSNIQKWLKYCLAKLWIIQQFLISTPFLIGSHD